MNVILENYNEWCSKIFDKDTVSNVINLKKKNSLEFEDSFYKNLTFGGFFQ